MNLHHVVSNSVLVVSNPTIRLDPEVEFFEKALLLAKVWSLRMEGLL